MLRGKALFIYIDLSVVCFCMVAPHLSCMTFYLEESFLVDSMLIRRSICDLGALCSSTFFLTLVMAISICYFQKLQKLVEHWMEKYDKDVEAKQKQLDILKASKAKDLERLKDLTKLVSGMFNNTSRFNWLMF